MTVGARIRAVLLLTPVVAALIVLVAYGLADPHALERALMPSVLTGAVLIVGVPSTFMLFIAAVRGRGRLSLSWGAFCVAGGSWTAALFGAMVGWNETVIWVGLRGTAFVAVGFGLLAAPGVRRTPHDWGLLLLDGWLVGASALLIGWVALRTTGSPLAWDGHRPNALYWVPFDLVIASVIAGLAARTSGSARAPVVLLVVASLLAVTSDTTWALTRSESFGVPEWLIMLAALGGATLTRRLDVWAAPLPDQKRGPSTRFGLARPQFTRLAQMSVVPGLLAAAAPGTDTVTFLVAASVIVVLSIEIVLVRRQHDHVWHALHQQAQRLDQLLRDSRDAIVQVDDTGMVEFANDAVADVFGYDPRSLVGQNGIALIHPKDRDAIGVELGRLTHGEQNWVRVSGRFRDGDGHWRHLESTVSRRTGGPSGFTLSVRDISERNRMEVELRRLANTDDLTGLLNRQAFLTLLENRLPRGDASVLFIDLDSFKSVNDTAGHAAGDRLLREVADALRAEMRPGDIAARLGGDEFAVLPAVRSLEGARALAARLVDCLSRTPSQTHHRIGASIGVAAGHHVTAEALLTMADLAMYEAKAAGGSGYLVFEPGVRKEVVLARRGEPERANPAEVSRDVVDVREIHETRRPEDTILADQ